MKYDFDKVINREETNSIKWEANFIENQFGYRDLLPMWIADMDFKCPQPVIDALIKRVEHGIYGYSQVGDEYYQAVVNWNKKRHGLEINKDWIVFVPGVLPALNYLIQTFSLSGDKIIIQNPVYSPLISISEKFAKFALDEGHIFGKGGECFARINFACPISILEESLHRIEEAIHS